MAGYIYLTYFRLVIGEVGGPYIFESIIEGGQISRNGYFNSQPHCHPSFMNKI